MNHKEEHNVFTDMSKWFAVGLLLVVACSENVTASTPGVAATSTTIAAPVTTSPAPSSTSTSKPVVAAGHLVRVDPSTLDPVAGLDRFPLMSDSWSMLSTDQSLLVNFEWDDRARINYGTVIDVAGWEQIGSFELGPHTGRVVHQATVYAYDHEQGRLLAVDVRTGDITTLATWPKGLWLWDDLHALPGRRIAALGTASTDSSDSTPEYSVFVYDPPSAATTEIPVGEIERVVEQTGVYDGDYEIPERDSPGVAWGEDRVYIVHADEPEVLEVDFEAGVARNHTPEVSSWWDRLLANWTPAAAAKGPSLGTYSSAALSPDGRYLYISGNRQLVGKGDDGTLQETTEALGLTVIDTETWKPIESPDLSVHFVNSASGQVSGYETVSLQPWIDGLHLLAIGEAGVVLSQGPFHLSNGGCGPLPDRAHLLCFESASTGTHVRVINIESQETISGRTIGFEDVLHSNGVLEDWLPTTDE